MTRLDEWKPIDDAPYHGQKVKTRSSDGREFECEYFNWHGNTKPYFKLIGKVLNHDNVTHWMPLPKPPKEIK